MTETNYQAQADEVVDKAIRSAAWHFRNGAETIRWAGYEEGVNAGWDGGYSQGTEMALMLVRTFLACIENPEDPKAVRAITGPLAALLFRLEDFVSNRTVIPPAWPREWRDNAQLIQRVLQDIRRKEPRT